MLPRRGCSTYLGEELLVIQQSAHMVGAAGGQAHRYAKGAPWGQGLHKTPLATGHADSIPSYSITNACTWINHHLVISSLFSAPRLLLSASSGDFPQEDLTLATLSHPRAASPFAGCFLGSSMCVCCFLCLVSQAVSTLSTVALAAGTVPCIQ